jgi:hypothetical protein
MRICIECEIEFDERSPEKRRVGGLISCCPDCSKETTIKYAGVQAADGKQAQATILKFKSEQDKKQYINFWQNNSGFHKGKSCQLGAHLSTTPNISFQTITAFNPTNHKGKAL